MAHISIIFDAIVGSVGYIFLLLEVLEISNFSQIYDIKEQIDYALAKKEAWENADALTKLLLKYSNTIIVIGSIVVIEVLVVFL